MSNSVRKSLMITSFVLVGVNALSLMSSLIVDFDGSKSKVIFSYIASALFWASFIVSWIIQFVCYKSVKKQNVIKGKIAIVTFFSNKYAMVFDILTLVFLLAVVILLISKANMAVLVIIISLFIFAFQMRIILNSNNYKYIFNLKEKRKRQ